MCSYLMITIAGSACACGHGMSGNVRASVNAAARQATRRIPARILLRSYPSPTAVLLESYPGPTLAKPCKTPLFPAKNGKQTVMKKPNKKSRPPTTRTVSPAKRGDGRRFLGAFWVHAGFVLGRSWVRPASIHTGKSPETPQKTEDSANARIAKKKPRPAAVVAAGLYRWAGPSTASPTISQSFPVGLATLGRH